jgi:hypothetical protein
MEGIELIELGTFITSIGILLVNVIFYTKKWNNKCGEGKG